LISNSQFWQFWDTHEFPLEAPLGFVDAVTEAAAWVSQLV